MPKRPSEDTSPDAKKIKLDKSNDETLYEAMVRFTSKEIVDYPHYTLGCSPINWTYWDKPFREFCKAVDVKLIDENGTSKIHYAALVAFWVIRTNRTHYGSYELQILLHKLFLDKVANFKNIQKEICSYLYHQKSPLVLGREKLNLDLINNIKYRTFLNLPWVLVHRNTFCLWEHSFKSECELQSVKIDKYLSWQCLDLTEKSSKSK